MLILRITDGFLNEYRQYKIDLVEGAVKEDICYKALEHLLNGGKTLSYLKQLCEKNGEYDINIITGEVSNSESDTKMIKAMMKQTKMIQGLE